MTSRLFARSLIFQKLKNIKLRSQKRNYGHDEHHMTNVELRLSTRTTADFLPQAQGSWAELNNKRQAINNQTLGLGILVLLSGLFGPAALGMWELAVFSPPKDKINKDFPGAKYVE